MNLKTLAILTLAALPAVAGPVFFSTGLPDGLIGTASGPSHAGTLETETADDFVLAQETLIRSATFTGLLPRSLALSAVNRVEIEFYNIFPLNSVNPPSGRVPSRTNSPSDTEIPGATTDSSLGTLSFTTTLLSAAFTVANSVVSGVNAAPNSLTGGEGSVTGEEVQFSVTFTNPIDLQAGHYFFRPEVGLSSGNFLWLSAPRPIVAPGTPINPDLQTWIRNSALSPDWLRVGTDITGQGPYNASFSLSGDSVPEPSSWMLMAGALSLFVRRAIGAGKRRLR